MGKIHLHTKEQEIILDELRQTDFLTRSFYFTGGTALSAYYLHHRYSDDLDFFTQKRFDQSIILSFVESWSKKYHFTFSSRFVEVVYMFFLDFSNKEKLKIDFSYYPYPKIENEKIVEGVKIDSLTDIAINKLNTISQRTEVKDFVDLYFLLDTFSLWDLIEGVRQKFRIAIDPLLLASDFFKVEDFTSLPRMIKPLTLSQLQSFFREKAKEVGRTAVI